MNNSFYIIQSKARISMVNQVLNKDIKLSLRSLIRIHV